MAGGKQTPRQKMINLMYLVFIAMMALNMSKEALTAFGLLGEKFEEVNKVTEANNEVLINGLSIKASDEPAKYSESYKLAQQVQVLSNDFYKYIENLKQEAIKGFKIDPETGKLPYEQMDKGESIDYSWFSGDKYSAKGNEIIARFKKFRNDFKSLFGTDVKYQFLLNDVEKRFNTDDVKNKSGQKIPYLEYHFKGYPAVASSTYLASIQNDIRAIEQEAYTLLLGNSLKQAASMRNYQAMVVTDKSVYFTGEPIKGKVVLGRFDKNTIPTEVVVNGSKVNLNNSSSFSDGQVQLNMTAGSLGEHKFSGHFTFLEDGEPIKVDIQNSNYVVVSRPNTATIAADKMNVVYMGLDNPISASFSGIPSDKVNVVTSGGTLKKVGDGKYILRPAAAREVTITATGTMSDGKTVSDKKVFRIKPVPRPSGTVRGAYAAEGPVSNFKIVSIGAKFDDFDFDVDLQVTQFTVVFPGIGSTIVRGSTKLNAEAIRMAERLKPGDVVTIKDIKVKLTGVDLLVKDAANATYTIK